jgi:uncharacterized protein (TIGR02246 family)
VFEDPIRERFETFVAAWNAHDVGAMTDCFVATGNITHPWGAFAVGRDEIARLLASEHEGTMKESRMQPVQLRVRALSEGSAVADFEGVLQQVLAPNGAPYQLPHFIHAVLIQQDGWFFLSMNPSVDQRAGG